MIYVFNKPTIIPIAQQSLIPDGMNNLTLWLERHSPEVIGDRPLLSSDGKVAASVLLPEVPASFGGSISDNEALVELAGRNCYKSYGIKAGRKTNAEYIANLLGSPEKIPHACYDAETEVLTASGWKRFAHLDHQDRLATRTESGQLEYHEPIRLYAYEHDDDMYRVQSPNVDLLVTPNHKMLVCFTSTREGRQRASFELVEASEIGNRSHCYVKDAEWAGGLVSTTHDQAVLSLLGFTIGDGRIQDAGQQVEFHLRRSRKIAWLRQMASRAEFELRETKGDRYALCVPKDQMPLFRSIYDAEGEKQIPEGVLLKWDRAGLEALLEGLIASDGSVGRTQVTCERSESPGDHTNYSSTSLRLLDQVQQLALHCGHAAHLHVRGEQCPHVNFIEKNLRPEFSRGSFLPRPQGLVPYKGMVYCAEVPNHTLYVRRNGIPVWSGNSVTYHAKMTFFFGGISRRMTHELIRHYVGADRSEEGCPSQESTRYVEHPGHFVAHPRHISDSGEVDRAFLDAMQSAHQAYQTYIEKEMSAFAITYGGEPKGMDRKRIYEAAAAILPGAAATTMTWTTNPTALSKLFVERCDSASDLEFQRFATGLREVCYWMWPNLFRESNVACRK